MWKGMTFPFCYMLAIFIKYVPQVAEPAPGTIWVFWPSRQWKQRLWNRGATELLRNQSGPSGVNIKSPDTHTQKSSGSHYSVPSTQEKYIHSYKLCQKLQAVAVNLYLAVKSAASISGSKKTCLCFLSVSLLIKDTTLPISVFLTNSLERHTYKNMPLGWYFKVTNGIQMLAHFEK